MSSTNRSKWREVAKRCNERRIKNKKKTPHQKQETTINQTTISRHQSKIKENVITSSTSTLNCSGETKQGDTATNLHSSTNTHLSYLVQPRLHGKRQRLPSLKVLWIRIFSYSGPTEKETVSLRCYCKLFSKALKPLPCWTSFPHPRYASLGALFNHLTALSTSGSTNIPKVVLIENGVHVIEDEYHATYGRVVNMVVINLPISIIGESREHCIVMGGLWMQGKKEDDVNVIDLTLRNSKADGVEGYNGASIHLDNVSVENSGSSGVGVFRTKRNSMKNCNVSHSKSSGLYVYGGLVTIDGKDTTIHHNCTNGESSDYGLHTWVTNRYSSSSIHLASSLTIEMISKNNGGGGNHGGNGTIKTITNNTREEKK
jgi:hypothetical protein